MPFVIEKVTEMLYFILQPSHGSDDGELPELPEKMRDTHRASLSADQNEVVDIATRLAEHVEKGGFEGKKSSKDEQDRMRKKVRTVARMARMFKTLRQENETVIRLKGVCPGHKLSAGLLLAGKDRMNTELDMFEHASTIDKENEVRPENDIAEGAREFAVDEGGDDAEQQ